MSSGSEPEVRFVRVFAAGPNGGNPAPIVLQADGMSDGQMQQVAQSYGHESGFVLPPPPGSDCHFEFRFWVPNHEMSMCGHATVGAVWLLDRLDRLPSNHLAIWTKSGRVEATVSRCAGQDALVEISQPVGVVEPLPAIDGVEDEILAVLGIASSDLGPLPIQNARTSRVKTLVPVKSVSTLDGLTPDFGRIEQVCARIDSTGLYPYAISDRSTRMVDARQFPRSSGYPEDAATGIAASALSFALLSNHIVAPSTEPITIRQGRAMRRPSEIRVRFKLVDGVVDGCWLGGTVLPAECEKRPA